MLHFRLPCMITGEQGREHHGSSASNMCGITIIAIQYFTFGFPPPFFSRSPEQNPKRGTTINEQGQYSTTLCIFVSSIRGKGNEFPLTAALYPANILSPFWYWTIIVDNDGSCFFRPRGTSLKLLRNHLPDRPEKYEFVTTGTITVN